MGGSLDHFWELIGGVFALEPEVFRWARMQPLGSLVILVVVLAAGLSQAIAQSIVLFINRVRPIRYVLTLLIGTVLFVFGYFFLVLSTWLVSRVPFNAAFSFRTIANILGISYAPLLFSCLGALPYLGAPILRVLSFWQLLAMVGGFAAVANITRWEAVSYVILGWVMLQILERTIGQPLANFGNWLTNTVAGVNLATDWRSLRDLLQTGRQQKAWSQDLDTPLSTAYGTRSPLVPRLVKQLFLLLSAAILAIGIIFLLLPIREWLFSWYTNLRVYERLSLDLIWLSLLALVVAGLIAPLEALGWWAGWYGDRLDNATTQPGILTTPIVPGQAATRYVIYLDGIGQSNYQHLPAVEHFLAELEIILPDDIRVIKGIMPYSVLNNPLTTDRPLAFFWRLAERLRLSNRASILSFLVNLRNVLVVAVSADQRYGPIYNQGIAQVIHNGLIYHGYQPDSGIPISLIGYSGGGQLSAAAAPFLRDSLNAPIDIVSLGGVISGNVNLLAAEHLYHLVGKKDLVERLGAVMFPRRWRSFFLSYWNRVKRRGKISFISLGPVGHNVPGGLFDAKRCLPDGRTYLQQTLEWVAAIVQGDWVPERSLTAHSCSNYQLYQQSESVQPDYYPLDQTVSPDRYRPIADWIGRLILPQLEQRHLVRGVLFEIHHAADPYTHLVGKIVYLRWSKTPSVQRRIRAVTRDLHFSEEADFTQQQGLIHPERLNHWRQVDPLESLAGAHPVDDVVVMLPGSVVVELPAPGQKLPADQPTILSISREPVQITGRFYALVQFIESIAPPHHFRVTHYNRASRSFDGISETVYLPPVVPNQEEIALSTSQALERSPLNQTGWYIYGAKNATGTFVVQAIAPRALFRLTPDQVIIGSTAASHYIKKTTWADLAAQKGKIASVLLCPKQRLKSEADDSEPAEFSPTKAAIAQWQVGDAALLVHVYGGIGGNKREASAKAPVYFGHFAYGIAHVVHEPLTNELRFDIVYHQVYTHNTDGLIAGSLHWSRYMGDRQFGWLGTRPISDILIKFEAFTEAFDLGENQRSPLDLMMRQLEVMTARYRIGDGTGATYVGPANNCAQDSNQALYVSIRSLESFIQLNHAVIEQWTAHMPKQVHHYQQLLRLEKSLKRKLMLFGLPRPDWEKNAPTLGSTLEDAPLQTLLMGLGSWRTMLPRLASDTIVTLFLRQGAAVWVLRTNQVGGWDADIESIAPMTLPFI